jgi:hypothetical protein
MPKFNYQINANQNPDFNLNAFQTELFLLNPTVYQRNILVKQLKDRYPSIYNDRKVSISTERAHNVKMAIYRKMKVR